MGAAFGVMRGSVLTAKRRARFSPRFAAVTQTPEVDSPPANDRRAQSPSRRVGTARARRSLAAQFAAQRSRVEVIADRLARAASSTPFLVVHAVWFAFWVLANMGLLGIAPWDPFPFGLLTLVVSLEAIFLSIFVLMAQSRESEVAELREEVSLQVVLRMEEEVTKTLQLVAGLYSRLGHTVGDDAELQEMLGSLDPDRIERDLLEQINDARRSGKKRNRLDNNQQQ
jgi:uncharacterized membrane protein